jgi:hypothetical protein
MAKMQTICPARNYMQLIMAYDGLGTRWIESQLGSGLPEKLFDHLRLECGIVDSRCEL